MQAKSPKTSTKTHRRSRTGCFTCRLRRKKCDEGKPLCRACKHLGLVCDYKRPVWWGSSEHRKRQKENIKQMIKRTKLTEKSMGHLSPGSTGNTLERHHRSLSIESGFSLEHDVVGVVGDDIVDGFHDFGHHDHLEQYPHLLQPQFQRCPGSFDFDQKPLIHQPFGVAPLPIQHVPPRRPSSTSSFGSVRRNSLAPSTTTTDPSYTATTTQAPRPEGDLQYFDFSSPPHTDSPPYIPVEDGDRRLMDHFLTHVQRLILPILDLHGTARHDVILPALQTNESYRHCCLSIAALHLKTTQNLTGMHAEYVDQDITRHRYATISGLCEALARDTDHLQILEATLGMILFQCSVGTPEDSLPDIPWHQHFQAATSLVAKLDLTRFLLPLGIAPNLTPSLNMTLASWIDILGATMLGRAPQFADTYREKLLTCTPSGLRELMGCDDRVMYLISETACLESLRDQDQLTDMELCSHVGSLAMQLDATEPPADVIAPPVIQSGSIDPRALTSTISAAFRCAARIYLCSLCPTFDRNQMQIVELLERLTACLAQIPVGWERSLVWVFLIGGSFADYNNGAGFRRLFDERCRVMKEHSNFGSFGRMKRVVESVWESMDAGRELHWREVMRMRGWDTLLI